MTHNDNGLGSAIKGFFNGWDSSVDSFGVSDFAFLDRDVKVSSEEDSTVGDEVENVLNTDFLKHRHGWIPNLGFLLDEINYYDLLKQRVT